MQRRRNWTAEEDERLLTMWARNWSASIVAAKLGRTRSSALGRLHRLGALNPSREATTPKIHAMRLPVNASPGNRHRYSWSEEALTEKWADRKARLAKERAQGASQ